MGNDLERPVNSDNQTNLARQPFAAHHISHRPALNVNDDDEDRFPVYDPDSFAAAADPDNLEYDGDKPVIVKGATGCIKWFNYKNGYGFIYRNDTFEDLFVHHSAFKDVSRTKLKLEMEPNSQVEFDVVLGEKGFEAANVVIKPSESSAINGHNSGTHQHRNCGRSAKVKHPKQKRRPIIRNQEFNEFDDDSDSDDDSDQEESPRYFSPSTSTSNMPPLKSLIARTAEQVTGATAAPSAVAVVEQPTLLKEMADIADYNFEEQLKLAIALSLQESQDPQAQTQGSEDSQQTSNKCRLCEEEQAQILFRPCDHFVCCSECSVRLKRCPECSEPIEAKINTATGEQLALSSKIKATDLLQRVTSLEEAQRCTICMNDKKNIAFDCGHMTCQSCSRNLNQCPLCRKTIRIKTKLYES